MVPTSHIKRKGEITNVTSQNHLKSTQIQGGNIQGLRGDIRGPYPGSRAVSIA